MRLLLLCCALLAVLGVRFAVAGEIRELDLTDGSVVTGEVVSLSNGVYTVKSSSLGTLRIEESKIRAIRSKTTQPAAGTGISSDTAKTLQEKMMGDKEVLNLIQSLQNDPDFKKILENPEIMKAVNAGDIATLQADPEFIKLLNNSTVKEIQKKAQ